MITYSETMKKNPTGEQTELLDHCIYQIAKGDQDALVMLYESTRTAVYGYALSICRNVPDAEDVLQDTYVQIWKNAGSYSTGGKPMAWIITIARNLALMCIRQNKKAIPVAPEDWQEYFGVQADIPMEDSILLTTLMETLKDTERQIIALHALAGFRHREIAAFLQMPLSTVLSKYHRGIKQLGNMLKEADR